MPGGRARGGATKQVQQDTHTERLLKSRKENDVGMPTPLSQVLVIAVKETAELEAKGPCEAGRWFSLQYEYPVKKTFAASIFSCGKPARPRATVKILSVKT